MGILSKPIVIGEPLTLSSFLVGLAENSENHQVIRTETAIMVNVTVSKVVTFTFYFNSVGRFTKASSRNILKDIKCDGDITIFYSMEKPLESFVAFKFKRSIIVFKFATAPVDMFILTLSRFGENITYSQLKTAYLRHAVYENLSSAIRGVSFDYTSMDLAFTKMSPDGHNIEQFLTGAKTYVKQLMGIYHGK